MTNRKATTALLLGLILIGGTIAMSIPSASAQVGGSTGTAALMVSLVDINGAKRTLSDSKTLQKFAVYDDATIKQLKEVEVTVRVVLPSTQDKITGIMAASPIAHVLTPEGVYQPVTIQNANKSVRQISSIQWIVYTGVIPINSIEALMGNERFTGELRVTLTSTNLQGTIGGKTSIFFTPAMKVTAPILKTTGTTPDPDIWGPIRPTPEPSDSGSLDPNPTPEKSPTGKVYQVVRVDFADGTARIRASDVVGPTIPFSISGTGAFFAPDAELKTDDRHKEISKITYKIRLYLDDDTYKVNRLVYANPAASGNYDAIIGGSQGIDKQVTLGPTAIGGKMYDLLTMTVTGQALENTIGIKGSTTSADGTRFVEYGEAKLTFRVRESTLNLTTPSNTFDVKLPLMSTALDLKKQVITDVKTGEKSAGGCEFVEDECEPETQSEFDPMMLGIAAAVAMMAIGGVVALKKNNRRRRGAI